MSKKETFRLKRDIERRSDVENKTSMQTFKIASGAFRIIKNERFWTDGSKDIAERVKLNPRN